MNRKPQRMEAGMSALGNRFDRSILGLAATAIAIIVASALWLAAVGAGHAAEEQVILTSRFYPTAGREAELEARLLRIVELVKKAEPDYTYRLHRSVKDPVVFMFYEIYPSQAAFDRHRTETFPAARQVVGPAPEGIL